MPTLNQLRDKIDQKIAKFGGNAHANDFKVMEEERASNIANKPDERGKQKTRIGLETYSPESYSEWNKLIEYGMEKCGFNPILFVDVMATILYLAGDEGFKIAHDQLCGQQDYEKRLREGRAAKKRKP